VKKALNTEVVKSVYERAVKRYDLQHSLLTAGSDERGRRLLVDKTVKPGDRVLDAGAGTGGTALLAAQKVGAEGKVVLFDLSESMLEAAKQKMEQYGFQERVAYCTGDIHNMPFDDESFDVVLSTYSLCPVHDPQKGAGELYRLVKKGGLLGIAHSVEPENRLMRWLSNRVESIVWRFPMLSLGCRAISVLPYLQQRGAAVLYRKRIGVPLWPFEVFVVQKPEKREDV
jgi:demethylmenaquinone methyltransferase/2-methoxy-6-polyprenyl-1,4-benzoquinol methylase